MPRLLVRLLGWAALPFLAALAWALATGLARAALPRLDVSLLTHPAALAFAGGLLFRILSGLLWTRLGREDPFEFIDTLEHELTHALLGYLTLSPPVSLSATLKGGGEVELRGSNPLAALAPYYLPLWGFLAVGLGLVVKPGLQPTWDILVFSLLGMFAYRLAREYRWRQTDLHVYGFLFSTAAVAVLLLLALAVVLHARGLADWAWVAEAPERAWNLIRGAWDAGARAVRRPG